MNTVYHCSNAIVEARDGSECKKNQSRVRPHPPPPKKKHPIPIQEKFRIKHI